MPLPADYLSSAGFVRPLLRTCMESQKPESCTKPGAAAAAVGATTTEIEADAMAPGAPPRVHFRQGSHDYCLFYALASALWHRGCMAEAQRLASLATATDTVPAGTNIVKWLMQGPLAAAAALSRAQGEAPFKLQPTHSSECYHSVAAC